MAVAFDAVGPSSSGYTLASPGASGTQSWTHVVGATATAILVWVAFDQSSTAGTVTCTVGGAATTDIGPVENGASGTPGYCHCFKLLNPPTGSVSVSVTYGSFGATPTYLTGGSMSFTGAAGFGSPVTVANHSATSLTLTATGVAATSMVAGFIGLGDAPNAASTGTNRFEATGAGSSGGPNGNSAGATNAGSGSVSVAWTGLGSGDTNCGLIVEVTATFVYSINSVGTPTRVHSTTGSVTGTWGTGQTLTPGDYLLAAVTAGASTSATIPSTSTSGWSALVTEGNSATAHAVCGLFGKIAVGSDTAPTFTSTETGTAGGMNCILFEFQNVNTGSPVDTSGLFASGSSTTSLTSTVFKATTTAAPSVAEEYAVAVFSQERAAANLTFTNAAAGWSVVMNGSGTSTVGQGAVAVLANPPTGSTLVENGAFSTDTTAYGALALVVLALAPQVTAGAIPPIRPIVVLQGVARAANW